jgi:hypothetical protein
MNLFIYLHYIVHYVHQHLKKNHKPWDIHTNVFNIQVRSLWEANANAQFILDPYVVAIYCTSYLTKVDKFVTFEMQYILNK